MRNEGTSPRSVALLVVVLALGVCGNAPADKSGGEPSPAPAAVAAPVRPPANPDAEFDPAAYATYYARVLEIPTPRWSTYWAAKLKLPPNPGVPATVQQRAWTSPIWYSPAS